MSVYLDHAATTPAVQQAVDVFVTHAFDAANPSSLHIAGRQARKTVEESRETLAQLIGCDPVEIIFTSGGTEADNLAIKGLWWANSTEDKNGIVISAVEHHAVLDTAEWLESTQGAELFTLPVNSDGLVNPAQLDDLLAANFGKVALVSVMWANNEVGAIQPIAELAEVCQKHNVVFHTDAVQAFGTIPTHFADSGIDAMSISAHKIGGVHGVGALVVRRAVAIKATVHGGGQESERRSGTLNTAGIAAFAAAASVAVQQMDAKTEKLTALRDKLISGVLAKVPDAQLNGSLQQRLPGNAHILFPGCEADAMMLLLDAKNISCSTGSACTAGVPQPSHVLMAMGRDERQAKSGLRFTLGHTSCEDDIEALLDVIDEVANTARLHGSFA